MCCELLVRPVGPMGIAVVVVTADRVVDDESERLLQRFIAHVVSTRQTGCRRPPTRGHERGTTHDRHSLGRPMPFCQERVPLCAEILTKPVCARGEEWTSPIVHFLSRVTKGHAEGIAQDEAGSTGQALLPVWRELFGPRICLVDRRLSRCVLLVAWGKQGKNHRTASV